MFIQNDRQASSNPLIGLILLASIAGAVIDWRYKRRGGKQPTTKDRLFFATAIFVSVAFGVAVYVFRGGSADPNKVAGAVGQAEGLLFDVLFALWEFDRWRVRRKYPIPPLA